jgi:hypothetical protein
MLASIDYDAPIVDVAKRDASVVPQKRVLLRPRRPPGGVNSVVPNVRRGNSWLLS